MLVADTDQFRGLNVSAHDAPRDRATAKLENSDEVGLNHSPFATGRPKLLAQPGNGGCIALREISGNILAKPRPQQESGKNNLKGEGDEEPRIWPGFDTLDEIRRSVPSVYRNKLPGLDAMVFEPHTKSFRERFLPLRLCIGVHNDKTSEVYKAGGKVWVYLRYNIDVNRSPSPQLELDFTSAGRHGQCEINRQDILDGRIDLEPAFANTQRSWLYIFALIRWYFLLASDNRLHNFLMHRIPFNVTFKRNLIQACKTYGPRQPTFDTEIKAPEYSDEDSEHEINIGAPHRKRGYKKEPGLAKVYKRDPEEAELSEEERVQRRRANNAKGRMRQTLVSQQAAMNAEVAAEFGESELPGRRGARSMVRQVKQEPKDNPSGNVYSPVKEMDTYFDTLPPDIPDYAIKRQPCDDS
ncbi:hypothetical protein BS50DRAFT_570172 [Corynespora cassiicola Philippines]|uniref:Uncharacterized protein n=1 Tax=Corynespora cassiicola Philippines TaxID=1448308 RepID=A0A2T2NYY9_CORCC|nr:hypothetical protein BS50DRAFT_570172 [Corynespora cassiicola Philippines]